jgi:hypothetical protein
VAGAVGSGSPSSPAGGRAGPRGIGVTRTHGACRCSSRHHEGRRSRRAGPSRSSPAWRGGRAGRQAAGDLDVHVMGGANVIRRALELGSSRADVINRGHPGRRQAPVRGFCLGGPQAPGVRQSQFATFISTGSEGVTPRAVAAYNNRMNSVADGGWRRSRVAAPAGLGGGECSRGPTGAPRLRIRAPCRFAPAATCSATSSRAAHRSSGRGDSGLNGRGLPPGVMARWRPPDTDRCDADRGVDYRDEHAGARRRQADRSGQDGDAVRRRGQPLSISTSARRRPAARH